MDLKPDPVPAAPTEFEGRKVVLRPTLDDGKVTWICGSPDATFYKHLPAECRRTLAEDR